MERAGGGLALHGPAAAGVTSGAGLPFRSATELRHIRDGRVTGTRDDVAMQRTASISRLLVRVLGVLQILLGLAAWVGIGRGLVPVHMLLGLVLVILLWMLAALGARAGAHPGRVALAVLWGLFVPVFGVMHGALVVGDWHWVIQVLHLLVGMLLLGQAEQLGRIAQAGRAVRTGGAPAGQVSVTVPLSVA